MHWFLAVESGKQKTYFENFNELSFGSVAGGQKYIVHEHSDLDGYPRPLLGRSKLGELSGTHEDAVNFTRNWFRKHYHLPGKGKIQKEESTKITYSLDGSFGNYDPKALGKNCQCMVIDFDIDNFGGRNCGWLMETWVDYEGRDQSGLGNWKSNPVSQVASTVGNAVTSLFW